MNQHTRDTDFRDPDVGFTPADSPPEVSRKARFGDARRRLRCILMIAGPALVMLVGGWFYVTGGRYVSTENAYVKADKVAVSAEVTGPVAQVTVAENQHVAKGAPLFTIDDRPYRVALARADAALKAAREDVAGLKASYQEKQAELKVARSNADFAERDFTRQNTLFREKFASQAKLDDARRNRDVARQRVAVVEQEIAQIVASLGGNPDLPVESQARYLEAKAVRDQAALDLERTVVRAPFAGIASNVPKPGQFAAPGTAMMSVVADSGLWIEANFKEDALTYVQPGQPVTIEVDTYPGRKWHGTVASIAQATGAEFSVLPPQNATGNWVKVVQRIPVRVAIPAVAGAPQLRAGMSASVEIDTGHRRGLIRTVTAWFTGGNRAEAAVPAPAS